MKILFSILVLLVISYSCYSQHPNYKFREPKLSDIKVLCDCVGSNVKATPKAREFVESYFEENLFKYADIKLEEYRNDTSLQKVKLYWDKYKTLFRCWSGAFSLRDKGGNILKYNIEHGGTYFIEGLVGLYDLDVSFVDPADGRNIGEWLNERLFQLIGYNGFNHVAVKVKRGHIESLDGYTPTAKLGLFAANSNWSIGGKVEYLTITENIACFDCKGEWVVKQKGGHEAEVLAYNSDFTKFKLKINKVLSTADMPKGVTLQEGTEVWVSIEGWGVASEFKK